MAERTRPRRVLIVDDDQDIVRILSTLLRGHGYDCVTAGTGAQGAIEFDLSGDVDLVITDLNMPTGDGISLVERVRRRARTPIVIITAFSREYAARAGALEHVTILRKPFDAAALLDLIEARLASAHPA